MKMLTYLGALALAVSAIVTLAGRTSLAVDLGSTESQAQKEISQGQNTVQSSEQKASKAQKQVEDDRAKLEKDKQEFGNASDQAKADEAQLKEDIKKEKSAMSKQGTG